MKKQLFPVIFCLLLILSSITAQSNYFVDNTNGNDSNNGTSLATPWKTVQKACNTAGPNSIIPATLQGWVLMNLK